MKRNKTRKTILIIFACLAAAALIAVAGFFIWIHSLGSSRTVTDMEKYERLCAEDSLLPALPAAECLGSYTAPDFYFAEDHFPVLANRWSYRLTLQYAPEDYAAQAEYLKETGSFVAAAGENTHGYSPEFTCGGFRFFTEDGIYFPKRMDFIGFDDETCRICFVYFEDENLDDGPDFPEFLKQYHLSP